MVYLVSIKRHLQKDLKVFCLFFFFLHVMFDSLFSFCCVFYVLLRSRSMKGGTCVVSSKLCSLCSAAYFFAYFSQPFKQTFFLGGGEINEIISDLEDERLQYSTEFFCVEKIQFSSICVWTEFNLWCLIEVDNKNSCTKEA